MDSCKDALPDTAVTVTVYAPGTLMLLRVMMLPEILITGFEGPLQIAVYVTPCFDVAIILNELFLVTVAPFKPCNFRLVIAEKFSDRLVCMLLTAAKASLALSLASLARVAADLLSLESQV